MTHATRPITRTLLAPARSPAAAGSVLSYILSGAAVLFRRAVEGLSKGCARGIFSHIPPVLPMRGLCETAVRIVPGRLEAPRLEPGGRLFINGGADQDVMPPPGGQTPFHRRRAAVWA
jgi:hypothetical protein